MQWSVQKPVHWSLVHLYAIPASTHIVVSQSSLISQIWLWMQKAALLNWTLHKFHSRSGRKWSVSCLLTCLGYSAGVESRLSIGEEKFISRRHLGAAAASLVSLLPLSPSWADENPGLFRAENSNAENKVEGVKPEEKIAISSTSSTSPLSTRSGSKQLEEGQVRFSLYRLQTGLSLIHECSFECSEHALGCSRISSP